MTNEHDDSTSAANDNIDFVDDSPSPHNQVVNIGKLSKVWAACSICNFVVVDANDMYARIPQQFLPPPPTVT